MCFWVTWITQDFPCNSNATSTDVLKDTSTDSLTIVRLLYTIKSCSLNTQYTCTLFPSSLSDSLTHSHTHATGQWIGKSKWHGGRARGSERLEEMKRVKRKEGKREWEAERVADGVDCKTGSDAHIVYERYFMNLQWQPQTMIWDTSYRIHIIVYLSVHHECVSNQCEQ